MKEKKRGKESVVFLPQGRAQGPTAGDNPEARKREKGESTIKIKRVLPPEAKSRG